MSRFALDRVPFSRFGSRISVAHARGDAAPDQIAGLYLRRVRGQLLWSPAFGRLVLLSDGREVEPKASADEALLRLSHGSGGEVEICFDGPDSLRLRGRGIGLRIRAGNPTITYSEGKGRATLNAASVMRRYEIESLSARLVLKPHWRDGVEGDGTADLLPGDDGCWEAAIDEYTSTWTPRRRRPFDACLDEVRAEFEAWLGGMPPAPDELQDARRLAAYVMWSCVVEPEGLLTRPTMLMSKHRMCSVWAWDNCFNAMALVGHDPALAWDQLLLFADHQDAFGAYPDVINAGFASYNHVKPPIHGWTAIELLRRNPDAPSRDTLAAMYDSLARWTRWWLDHRRLDGKGLPYYLHGNDAGWDNATMFDAGVPVVGPDLGACLVTQMDALSELAARFGKRSEATSWKEQADAMLAALLDELWTGDRFVAKLAHAGGTPEGETVATRSLIYTMPIILADRLPRNVVEKLVATLKTFLTAHGLASEHPDSPEYRPDGYWRGPVWAPSTYVPVWALERVGQAELARDIARRFCAMCANSLFAENFDALTGAPLCDPAYTWTASIFLLLAERLAKA